VNALEDAALAYAQEGLYVFPLQPHGKTPLTAHGLEDATTDPMTIETWWGRWPEANIGIRTGDLVVVDEDRLGALEEFAAEVHETIPATGVVKTGSGRHFYFNQPEGERIRNTAGRLAPGIDTRGDGGYVVAPPSVHPDGSIYEWLAQVANVTMPDWLAQRLTRRQPERTPLPDIQLGSTTPYGQRALEQEITAVALAVEGTRNHTLNTAAFALGQLVAGGEVDHNDAYRSLEAAAQAAGLPQNESSKTIRSGFTAGMDEPRRAPDDGRGNGVRPKLALVTEAATESAEDGHAVFLDSHEYINMVVEQPEVFLGSDDITVIPAGGLCVLAGRPGSGKTTLILDLACHLAAGIAWPNVDPENRRAPTPYLPARPLRVALIENEGPEEMFRVKLREKLAVFQPEVGSSTESGGCIVVQTWRWGSFSFSDRDAHDKAREELDDLNIDVVVGDPLASLGVEGVGSPAETRDFVQLLRPLGMGQKRAFLFLHHFRERSDRNEDELARISGAWGGHLDTLMTLSQSRSVDQARLAWPKLRWAKKERPNPIVLGRVWNTASFEAIAEEGDMTVLEPLVYAELARRHGTTGKGFSTANELAKELEQRRVDVEKALKGAPHLFVCITGQAAKELGRRGNAKLWGLVEWTSADTVAPEPAAGEDFVF
jgi:hypothetical protein